jgi:hypothetical protein
LHRLAAASTASARASYRLWFAAFTQRTGAGDHRVTRHAAVAGGRRDYSAAAERVVYDYEP